MNIAIRSSAFSVRLSGSANANRHIQASPCPLISIAYSSPQRRIVPSFNVSPKQQKLNTLNFIKRGHNDRAAHLQLVNPFSSAASREKSSNQKNVGQKSTAASSNKTDKHNAATQAPVPPEAYWATNAEYKYDGNTVETLKENYPNLEQYDTESLMEWKHAFDGFDRDCDGYISQADLQKNPQFSVEKSKLLRKYDKDENNLIDLGEFVEAMFNVDIQTVRGNFEGFDSVDIQLEFEKHAVTNPATSRKTLSMQHVKGMMKYYEFTCITERDAVALFEDMDRNKDGEIDFDDFKQWISVKS